MTSHDASPRALRIARDSADIDIKAARRAAADFLSARGIAIDREDLRETPARSRAEFFALADMPR